VQQQFVLSIEVSDYYDGPWVSPPALTLVLTFMVHLLSSEVGSCFEEEHEARAADSCSPSTRRLTWCFEITAGFDVSSHLHWLVSFQREVEL
jgi:hypothetical protein